MANNKNITFNQLEASMTKVKAEIDKKANTNHGTHVPTTGTANNATYLRNDNQWHKIVPSDIGAAPISHGDHVTYSNTSPSAPGTASAGSAANVSRGDHVHPLQTTVSGNAGTATKLQTARTLTIGNTGKSFNGSTNVSWSLSEIGAAPTSHNHTSLTGVTQLQFAAMSSDSAVMKVAVDSGKTYLDFEMNDDANEDMYRWRFATWDQSTGATTPYFNLMTLTAKDTSSARLTVNGDVTASSFTGNASSATKLNTARSINGTSFNGTANITTAKWGTARKINDVSVDGSADVAIPIKFWKSTVGDNNNKPYHRILTSGVVTSQWTDKVITVMASGNYAGGPFGIFRVLLRTNGENSDSNITIEWITRKGFGLDSIVANFIKTGGTTQADIFYKCAGTYNSITWTILGEGDRSSGNYYSSWTKINTAATATEVYTEAEMKALKSYTSTLIKGTDAAFVYASSTSDKLTTARTINGTSFNGTGNITTANWGTARTLTVGNTGKSVNGGGNVSWSIDEIGALKASKQGATDVNTLKTTGRYFIKGTPTNGPTTNNGVIDVAWDLGTPYQIFYPDNANTAYKRNWNSSNSTWSGWTQLKFTDTNTWRGVQNNLTSDATDQSLSAAQGKVLKGLVDGKAASNHSHNYLSVKGNNTINSTANDTTAKWGAQGNSVHWYTETGKINDQPSQWGYLVNIGQDSEVHQIWMAQAGGDLSHRGGNSSGWNGSWKTILDSSNYSNYAAAKSHTHNYAASNHNHDSAYLKLSGGTLSGQLTVNNNVQSQGFYVSKNGKEAWLDIGDNDTYIWASGANKSLQITHGGDLNFDGQPVLYGGRGNNYDTATGTIYFNNAGTSHKGRVSCYNNSNGDYVQLALRNASDGVNYLNIYDSSIRIGCDNIYFNGKKFTIASSAPSNPANGDVWINIG